MALLEVALRYETLDHVDCRAVFRDDSAWCSRVLEQVDDKQAQVPFARYQVQHYEEF